MENRKEYNIHSNIGKHFKEKLKNNVLRGQYIWHIARNLISEEDTLIWL
jgi:hypothetical protein